MLQGLLSAFTARFQRQRKRNQRVRWREEVGEIAGLESLFFDYLVGPGGSAAINVELTHPDPAILELAATDLAGALADYEPIKSSWPQTNTD